MFLFKNLTKEGCNSEKNLFDDFGLGNDTITKSFISSLRLRPLLGDGDEVLAVKLLQLLDDVLVTGLGQVENLNVPLLQALHVGETGLLALPGDVVDVLLVRLHSGDVVLEGDLVVPTGGGRVAEIAGQLLPVGGVLVDAELEVLAELLVELLEVVLVLGQLLDQLHHLLDQVLPDQLQDLVLLELFSGDAERQILGVDHTRDEVEILWDQLLAVVRDEDSPHVELEVPLLGSLLGDEQDSCQTLGIGSEMLDSEVLLPVVGQRLVEIPVFLGGDVVRSPGPDILLLVLLIFLLLLLIFLLLLGLLFLLPLPLGEPGRP